MKNCETFFLSGTSFELKLQRGDNEGSNLFRRRMFKMVEWNSGQKK